MNTTEIIETGLPLAQETLSDHWNDHVGNKFATKDANAADPNHILQTGFAFWASKTLLSAVGMEVFTELARVPATVEVLQGRLVFMRDRRATL